MNPIRNRDPESDGNTMSSHMTLQARRALAAATNRTLKLARRFRIDARGVAAIEMAFVFPMMLLVYFGLVDVTNLLAANRRVTLAASTIGDLVTQAPGNISKADLQGFYKAVQPIMDPFPSADVGINIFTYKNNGGTAQLKWQDGKGPSCGAPNVSGLTDLMAEGNDVVLAMACVDYRPITGHIVGSAPFHLKDALALRPRQNLTLDCANC
jgi:Flp pilus assembly protein TadG